MIHAAGVSDSAVFESCCDQASAVLSSWIERLGFDGDGYIDYGNGTASYYYSWTRMDVTGALDLGQGWQRVSGEAWMDHQWGTSRPIRRVDGTGSRSSSKTRRM